MKCLIVRVPADYRAFPCPLDYLAVRKIVSQQFPCIIRGETELWIT
jgi:hypothetical protein